MALVPLPLATYETPATGILMAGWRLLGREGPVRQQPRIRVSLVALALAIGAAPFVMAQPAEAAVPPTWNAGLIVTDANFYRSDSMTGAEIQDFIKARGSSCKAGEAPCLKDYTMTTYTIAADSYCKAYTGATAEPAWQIVAKVATACGINPQVLLVTMQKETALVTATQPPAWKYRTTMGFGCPDTAACDVTYFGFQNQKRIVESVGSQVSNGM